MRDYTQVPRGCKKERSSAASASPCSGGMAARSRLSCGTLPCRARLSRGARVQSTTAFIVNVGGGQMLRRVVIGLVTVKACGVAVGAQQQPPARPLSPPGSTQAQVLGRWVKGDRPSFAVGQERYVDGKWVEITYGRPSLRGRDVFGSGANYGKALLDLPLGDWGAPPVWRAGANMTTRLNTEAALTIGNKTIPAGEYSVFIDVKSPSDWTLIISSWPAQPRM